jgi:hypothetical protein
MPRYEAGSTELVPYSFFNPSYLSGAVFFEKDNVK